LVTGLARTTRGFNAILVFVDRLTKYVHLVPTMDTLTARGFASLFMQHVFANHGMPRSVVSDRDPRWRNPFWQNVCRALGISLLLSTAYHPQTDGQTERANRVIKEILASYVNAHQNDWDSWLPLVQFAMNNSWQESIRTTPFMLNFGEHPVLPSAVHQQNRAPASADFVKYIADKCSSSSCCYGQRAAASASAGQSPTP
jgi:transposase InsO family protein